MSQPMRIRGDQLPEGQLIVALVQRGPDVCAFAGGGCVSLVPGMIKLEDCPPLEELSPQFPLPKARA